jgi:hypothetical protein
MRLRTLMAALCLCAAGCAEVPEGDVVTDDEGPVPLSFQMLGFGTYAGETDLEAVARSTGEWQQLRATLDFARPPRALGDSLAGTMVLVAGAQVPHGGYALRFVSLEQDDDGLEATYVLLEPGEECTTAPAPQQPFVAARAPRIDAPVRFVRVVERTPCVLE